MKTLIEKYRLLKKEFELYNMKLIVLDESTYDMFIRFYELSSIDKYRLMEEHKKIDEEIFLLWEKKKLKEKLEKYKRKKSDH